MPRVLTVCFLALLSLCTLQLSAQAAGFKTTAKPTNWSQHDTAVYVVSTLNLVRTRTGRPASSVFGNRMGVTRYTVLDDVVSNELYFIELKKDDGSTIGAFAYQMGWSKPQALTSNMVRYGVKLAPSDIVSAYKSDGKVTMATFTTTSPS